MPKTLVFLADGTWNGPGEEGVGAAPTNVYKLFDALEGEASGTAPGAREKRWYRDGRLWVAARYVHGVGDLPGMLGRLLGGGFGAGLIGRIIDGHAFLSRVYEPGDDIVLAGFSRGAYTVRALAGLIAAEGLLAPRLTEDPVVAYRFAAKAWYRYRRERTGPAAAQLAEACADLPSFVSRDALQDEHLRAVPSIHAVAVWDTVGALGIPRYAGDSRVDAYRFTDARLSEKVRHGLHAVALDERRIDFAPALWDDAPNVVQTLFAGAHADVGGGYPAGESGLSDIALGWMMDGLCALGVRFAKPAPRGDALAHAHEPWNDALFRGRPTARRDFSGHALTEHPSVAQRKQAR